MLNIAFCDGAASRSVVPFRISWGQLCKNLSRVTPGQKDGPAWIPADISEGPRRSDLVRSISVLVLDVEQKKITPPGLDVIKGRIEKLEYAAAGHTSYNHCEQSPRYRLIFKLAEPLDPRKLKITLTSLAQKLGLGDCWDTACTDAARLFYTPRCPPGREKDFEYFETVGRNVAESDLAYIETQPKLARTEHTLIQFQERPQDQDNPDMIALIKSQLSCVSSDCDRNRWRDIVWSVFSSGLNCSYELAREWSQTAPERFEEHAFQNLFDTFDPKKSSGLKILHSYALEAGWRAADDSLGGSAKFTFRTLRQLAALPTNDWRVKGLFPTNALVSIYGPSGSGKSFLALDLLVKIATGENFFGHKTKICPVVYVALEGVSGIRKRLEAFELHHKIKIPETFRVVTECLSLWNSDVDKFAQAIIQEQLDGGVIVIDTLAQSAPQADENASADMGTIISNSQRLKSLTNGLVVLIHHTGKDSSKGARGHSSFMAALDSAIEVKKLVTGREWLISKSKDGEDGVIHTFRLETVNLGNDPDGEPITSCVALNDIFRVKVPALPKGKNQILLLNEIKKKWAPGSVIQNSEIKKLASELLSCNRPDQRCKEALQKLVELGYLTEHSGGYLLNEG